MKMFKGLGMYVRLPYDVSRNTELNDPRWFDELTCSHLRWSTVGWLLRERMIISRCGATTGHKPLHGCPHCIKVHTSCPHGDCTMEVTYIIYNNKLIWQVRLYTITSLAFSLTTVHTVRTWPAHALVTWCNVMSHRWHLKQYIRILFTIRVCVCVCVYMAHPHLCTHRAHHTTHTCMACSRFPVDVLKQ